MTRPGANYIWAFVIGSMIESKTEIILVGRHKNI